MPVFSPEDVVHFSMSIHRLERFNGAGRLMPGKALHPCGENQLHMALRKGVAVHQQERSRAALLLRLGRTRSRGAVRGLGHQQEVSKRDESAVRQQIADLRERAANNQKVITELEKTLSEVADEFVMTDKAASCLRDRLRVP
jgi:hypothetical protein